MLATLRSAAVAGITASVVDIQVDVSDSGMPFFTIVGLPDSTVRESRDRIRSALENAGYTFPQRRVVVNLTPADTRKSGASFDLPIALGLLVALGHVPRGPLGDTLVIGELSLDGRVQPSHGVLPVALLAARLACRLLLPATNVREGEIVEGIDLIPARTLVQILGDLQHGTRTAGVLPDALRAPRVVRRPSFDLAEVHGQMEARRAVEIAAAGRHNLLMIGPPGAGKTLLARRIPSVLPAPSFQEAIASTSIHSVAGLLDSSDGLLAERPFRAPHHTASGVALIGGGRDPRPGEISLAHNGILFLDEMVEFDRRALEGLREPLEEGVVRIARASRTVQFPARFLLVGAMNPCPCGYAGDASARCRCTPVDIHRYQSRISGPLRDRIDLTVRVEPVKFRALTGNGPSESSAAVRKRVAQARARQASRDCGGGSGTNADLTGRTLKRHCALDPPSLVLIERAMARLGLTGRSFDRVRRVARTIADLEGADAIRRPHVAEALHYRGND